MCKDPLHPLLEALPKCEHHLHLEGSLEPSLLFVLANKNGICLPSSEEDPAFSSAESLLERYEHFVSLDDFLHYYFIAMSALVTSEDFEALAWDYFVRAKSDGVVHAEVFFDPQAHAARGVEYATVLEGYKSACERAEAYLGLSTELIVCFLRHLPLEGAQSTYDLALPDLKSGVVAGIGLSSTEKGYPPHLYSSIFAQAEKENIRRTAHAGEEADVSYMRGALEDLHVQRVDHGIKLAHDPALLADFVQKSILITMCPVSNVKLRCVKTIEDLPVRTYLERNVPFSINSDDPAYFGGYILHNYCRVQETFRLTQHDWHKIAIQSIDGSWCSESRKGELRTMVEECF